MPITTRRLRPAITLLVLLLPALAGAQGIPLRVTSNIAEADILVHGDAGSRSGPVPLILNDLAPGVYRVSLYHRGREMAHSRVELKDRVGFKGSRVSRTVLSALFPGMGQWRDFGALEGVVPFGAVGTAGVRTLQFHSDRGQAQEDLDAWLAIGFENRFREELRDTDDDGAPDEVVLVPLTEAEYDKVADDNRDQIWLAEQTRNDYLALAGILHAGNVLTSNVRRGAFRLELAGANSLAARYQPPARGTVVVLSALWPGLGQTRAGHPRRALAWNLATLTMGMLVVESMRDQDEAQADIWSLERQIEVETGLDGAPAGATLAARAKAGRMVEDARQTRNALLLGGAMLWALNLADAVFLADFVPLDALQHASGGPQVDVGWVGEGPGLLLAWRF